MEFSRKIQISGGSKAEKYLLITSLKNYLREKGFEQDTNMVKSTITLLSNHGLDKTLSETDINLIKKMKNLKLKE